jgi:hypothetical protein
MSQSKPPHSSAVLFTLLTALALAAGLAAQRIHEIRQQPHWVDDEHGGHWSRFPCEREAGAYCPGVSRSDPAMPACLQQHADRLGEACKSYVEDLDPSDVWSNVCRAELSTFCVGRRYPVRCLREFRSQLSPRCATLLTRFDRGSQWRQACSEDAQQWCHTGSETDADSCLRGHLNDLSPSCRIYYATKQTF